MSTASHELRLLTLTARNLRPCSSVGRPWRLHVSLGRMAAARACRVSRLACLLDLEQAAAGEGGGELGRVRFSPHSLRHACATRNYERGVDLVAIQQMLGHWHVGTTMRYVTPSATFIEDAYRRAVSGTLAGLEGDGDAD